MKAIEFSNPASQRVYNNYINRCKRVVHILSKNDQEECLMEVNSYIFEYMQEHRQQDETTTLLNILDRIGDPEITLREVVAGKKIDQAVKTYHIKHLLQALYLNLRNGFAYILLLILTLLLLTFPVLIVVKLIDPVHTGLWTGPRAFFLGITDDDNRLTELLGNWFIPVLTITGTLLYFAIINILKALRKKKP
jgi:hypothetical protein